ncbi:MAG: hypothetical protein LKM38_22410 [Pseudomonas veronii]|nr:hypothetical protein [Pseudomonas veronii]
MGIATATQLQGKELSYNNIADADAALGCVKAFDGRPASSSSTPTRAAWPWPPGLHPPGLRRPTRPTRPRPSAASSPSTATVDTKAPPRPSSQVSSSK